MLSVHKFKRAVIDYANCAPRSPSGVRCFGGGKGMEIPLFAVDIRTSSLREPALMRVNC